MNIKDVIRGNRVTVTGELVNYDLKVQQGVNDLINFISGKVAVKSIINGREQITELDFYSKETTLEGKPNKLFMSYVDLESKVGKRVTITGEIQENLYYQESGRQVVSYNRVAGRFVNDAKTNEPDQSKFEFAGYVVKEVSERLNKDGELLFHEITLAEANYNGTIPVYVKFAIRNENIVKAVNNLYEKGLTVKITGDYIVETETNEVTEETAFGEPIVRTYTSSFRNFVITSGTNPAEKGAYSDEHIAELEAAYQKRILDLEEGAREDVLNGDAAKTNSNVKIKTGLGKSLL